MQRQAGLRPARSSQISGFEILLSRARPHETQRLWTSPLTSRCWTG